MTENVPLYSILITFEHKLPYIIFRNDAEISLFEVVSMMNIYQHKTIPQ